MRNQSATDSQQQTVTIGGLAPSVNLLYQLPCPAHMPHPRWRNHSRAGRERKSAICAVQMSSASRCLRDMCSSQGI